MAPNQLETLWRSRLREADLRLEFARNLLKQAQRDFPLSDPSPDGRYAYRRTIRLERLALQEYRHLQQILYDLQHGKVPDEDEWQRRMAPGAGLM